MLEKYKALIIDNISILINKIAMWFEDPLSYFEIIFILCSLTISFLLAKIIRNKIPKLKEPDKRTPEFSKSWFIKRAGRFVFPILLSIFLFVSFFTADLIIEKSGLTYFALQMSFVYLIWVALSAFVTSTLIRVAVIWILLPAATLKLFGLFDIVVKNLNDYGFTLGEFNITAYTAIKGIFFICIVIWLGKLSSNAGEGYIRKNNKLTRATKELLIKLFDIVLYTSLFLITLNLIGIDLTALAVFSGALGVGLGFGLQKIASNFISGIILLTERSININDLIEMDDGVFGYVRTLGSRASVIETFDGKEVMVPNEDFITSRVSNLTHTNTKGRIEVNVGVSYDTDLKLAHKIILDAALNYPHSITKDPDEDMNPKCFLQEFGDSSVNFWLTFWLNDVTKGRWRAKSDVMFVIWDEFKKHNIEIPFPQRDLHIKSGLENFSSSKPKKSNKTKK